MTTRARSCITSRFGAWPGRPAATLLCALGAALLAPALGADAVTSARAAIVLGDRGGPDADGDGVADDIDRCPQRRGHLDNIGCPDRDEDGDGLVDRLDRCPSVAGPRQTLGCPDGQGAPAAAPATSAQLAEPSSAGSPAGPARSELVRLVARRFEFTTPVQFEPATDRLTPAGLASVEAVAAVLKDSGEKRRVVIGGHVDEPGNTDVKAKALSLRRAEAVKKVLVERGLPAQQLRTKGFGYSRMLDKSETPEAALRNNRIEVVILEDPRASAPKAPAPAPTSP